MRTVRNAVLVCLVVFSLVGASGCRKPAPTPAAPKLDKVSVRMKWFFAGTMAPWFAGKDHGLYRKAGIDLSITPGGPDNSSVKLVAAGTDTFGVAGADEVLLSRGKGIPAVAVAVLFKDSPIGFVSKKAKGITSPAQWTGKTIEVSYGSNAELQYRALVKKFGAKSIKEVPYTFNLQPFMEGKVDVSIAYMMDQVVTLQRQGIALNIIAARDNGVNPYGDVIIVTDNTLREHPDLVKRFVQATVESFQWSIEHPKEAVDALVKGAQGLKADNELAVWKATIPFLTPEGGSAQIGVMKGERWRDTMKMLVEFKALKAPVDLTKAYKDVLEVK
jgi:NitT/TauT family transport system substrate-binding protein